MNVKIGDWVKYIANGETRECLGEVIEFSKFHDVDCITTMIGTGGILMLDEIIESRPPQGEKEPG